MSHIAAAIEGEVSQWPGVTAVPIGSEDESFRSMAGRSVTCMATVWPTFSSPSVSAKNWWRRAGLRCITSTRRRAGSASISTASRTSLRPSTFIASATNG